MTGGRTEPRSLDGPDTNPDGAGSGADRHGEADVGGSCAFHGDDSKDLATCVRWNQRPSAETRGSVSVGCQARAESTSAT